jgi:hypothetical protein
MKLVDKGPSHAHVVKLEQKEVPVVEDESSFETRH